MNLLRRTWPLLVLPFVLLLWMGNGFPYLGEGTLYSDFALSHYANALYLRQALTRWHAFPWWSPLILSGAPFAADPLASVWYPPHYLALLFPLPFGLHLTAALHLLWGGLGMYRLLREEGVRPAAALFGGIAFQALPKLWAHYAAGHLTLWYALAWTPWALLPARGKPAPLTGFSAVVWAFLADPRWGVFAGLLWLGRALPAARREGGEAWRGLKAAALPLLLAAPYAALLLQFAHHSTRAGLTSAEALTFSLPPARLLGLLLPLSGSQEYTLYPAAAVLSLALLTLLWDAPRRKTRFWSAAALLSLAFALGEHLPFFAPLLVRLPGLRLLRVPSRALFVFGMALIALAAHGMDALTRRLPAPPAIRRLSLALAGTVSLAWMLAAGLGAASGQGGRAWLPLLWGAAFLTVSAAGLGFALRKRYPPRAVCAFFIGVLLLDAGSFAFRTLAIRPAAEVLSRQATLASYLAAQEGTFRVYSPSYSLPQEVAARYALHLADGVNPLQINGYAQFMRAATGVPQRGYSVTLPPFADDPATDNAACTPDARLLGLLNVRFVAAEFDLHAPGLQPVRRFGRTRLYENTRALGPAWVQPPSAPPGAEARPLPESAFHWRPDRITVQAEGPGLLVLSEVAYPGWKVRLDGAPAEMLHPAGILRAVLLPPGAHEAVFEYRLP